jgi:putative metallohydrolase (TIGR04338 family)
MIRYQQDEIYAAERGVTRGRWFNSVSDAQTWLDSLRETWWWERLFWNAPARTEVHWRARGSSSVGKYDAANDGGVIEMLPDHRNQLFMLHELAHVIAAALNDSQAHDPFFARTYATLVYCVLGSDVWLELQREFDAHGVDYMQGATA